MQQQAPFEEWEIFSIPGDAISSKQLHISRKKSTHGNMESWCKITNLSLSN
jgi:hypothetical protein